MTTAGMRAGSLGTSEDDRGGCKGVGRRHAKNDGEDEGGDSDKDETEKEYQSDEDDRKEGAVADNRDDAHRAPASTLRKSK